MPHPSSRRSARIMKQEPQFHEQYERDEQVKGSSNRTFGIVFFVVFTLGVPLVHAQSGSAFHIAQAPAPVPSAAIMADAEVRKVDKDAAKITLRHGEIKNLDMPAMTMVFQVKNKAMLDQVKVGDKVRFAADKIGGAITITELEPTK